MDDRRLYETILGLESPWYVERVDVALGDDQVRVHLEIEEGASFECPECGQRCPRYDRTRERRWRHLDTCQYQTILFARIPRIECAEHGVRQIRVGWAENRSQFTALFEALAIRLLREMSILAMADTLGISWDEAEGIQKRAVARGLLRRRLEPARVLGVDETSFQKRHEYVTIACDLERDRVLWVGDDRKKETLDGYYQQLSPDELEAIEVVVMDMWKAYISSTEEHVPAAGGKIVFDKFHVIAHLNDAVDEVRRQEHKVLLELGDETLKRTRFLWLIGDVRRSDEQTQKIDAIRKSGYKVGRAWAIKEWTGNLWTYTEEWRALQFFWDLYAWGIRSQLEPIKKVMKMMKEHLVGIVNFVRHPWTNAMTEGINSRIQHLKARARGYRNRASFRRAILFHLGGLDMDPLKSL